MSSVIAVSGRRVRLVVLGAACLFLIFSTSDRVAGNNGLALLSTTAASAPETSIAADAAAPRQVKARRAT